MSVGCPVVDPTCDEPIATVVVTSPVEDARLALALLARDDERSELAPSPPAPHSTTNTSATTEPSALGSIADG